MSMNANKSFKRTNPGFDPVTSVDPIQRYYDNIHGGCFNAVVVDKDKDIVDKDIKGHRQTFF